MDGRLLPLKATKEVREMLLEPGEVSLLWSDRNLASLSLPVLWHTEHVTNWVI